MLIAPIVHIEAIDRDHLNRLLVEWNHRMNPVLATDTLETCQHLLKFTLTDAKCVEGDDE